MAPKRPSKRAMAAAAVNTTPVFTGSEPRSFQLPPYREDRPSLWFRQAEGQMTMRNITNDYFKVILVQAALTNVQQDAVASILEQDPLLSDAYQLLKAELIRLHEKRKRAHGTASRSCSPYRRWAPRSPPCCWLLCST